MSLIQDIPNIKKLKEYEIMVAIGSDAHSLRQLANITEPLERIKDYELERNLGMLIEHLRHY